MKSPELLDFNYKCQVYGRAYGYSGLLGGWIYNSEGIPVCQGWINFYKLHGRKIEAYMKARYEKGKERKAQS